MYGLGAERGYVSLTSSRGRSRTDWSGQTAKNPCKKWGEFPKEAEDVDVGDRDPYLEEQVKIRQENQAKLKAWEEQRQFEAEERERREKQGALEGHLRRRAEEWREVTGSLPSPRTIDRWQEEYVDKLHAERERDLQARREQAARDFPI